MNSGSDFAHVFEPLTIRHRTLRARINFGAHTANMALNGLPGDQHIGYYRERALGGAGLIVVEPVPVHPTGVLTRGNFRCDDDSVIPHFRRLTETCHEAAYADGGVTMIQQLYHVGQHGDADNSFQPNWSPSGLASLHDSDGSHAVTEAEIDELIASFVRAGVRAKHAGFDGIEVFAAYHALIDQFWTPWSNRRDDRWGATFEDRMRFSRSVLEGLRSACGDEFVIGLAVSIDPETDVSLSVESMQEIVAWHDERELMDYVTCGTGSYFDFYKLMPTSLYPQRLGERFATALKRVVRYAKVQCESHVRTAEAAERVIAAGSADMVSIVRGQIADPHLVRKAREGRAEQTRPCISCNQMCWGRRSRDYFITCLVNPSAGREFQWGGDRFEPAAHRKRVVVVGGGPAGIEAARVAGERGHDVTVFESSAVLGGQWRLAGLQPTRGQILDHLDWYERELRRLGVTVHLHTPADADLLQGFAADEIVIATGARPSRLGFQRARLSVDSIPGINEIGGAPATNVAAIHDVLAGFVAVSGRVLLVDDLNDWRGIGTAMFLQEQGCAVTLATAASHVAGGLFHSAADVPARQRFARSGGATTVFTTVDAWHGNQATLTNTLTGASSRTHFDWLITAELPVADTALGNELSRRAIQHHTVGDCVAPRRAILAIYEARRHAQQL